MRWITCTDHLCSMILISLFLQANMKISVCRTITPISLGTMFFLLICPNSTPHNHTSLRYFFFIPVLSFRIAILSHTQKHGCYSMNHLFPQKTAWPFAKKVDSISGETAKTIRKQMQLQLQNPDVTQGKDLFIWSMNSTGVFYNCIDI